MRILYYDCFSGISGDMNLGAMVDIGVDQKYLMAELKKLNLDSYEIIFKKDKKNGIEGTKASVLLKDKQADDVHRNLKIIESIIEKSELNENVKRISSNIFRKLGQAEAHVHGMDINEIHFHEVGAVDSIIDIVGAAICFDYLKPDKVICSSIELGGGFVKCAHGVLPVPAPATVEILKNIPVKKGGAESETTTPTGAAILFVLVDEYIDKIDFSIIKTAYGIGHRDMKIPNVLRVYLGEMNDDSNKRIQKDNTASIIETNIDDMNPELYDHIFERLFSAGAMDVYLTPIIMKKGRPANTLSVICGENICDNLSEILLTETTSLGVRKYSISKYFLRREFSPIETRYGKVSIKYSYLGNKMIGFKPEYEDCKRLAVANNIPIKKVYQEVNKLITNKDKN